jgi:hypothetical protein
MMKREDYTFEELLQQNDEPTGTIEAKQMSLDLTTGEKQTDDEGTLIKEYKPVHYRRLKQYG